jgi:hypothetical protein
VEAREREASLKQDVDRPSDEPVRLHAQVHVQACRSSVSAVAVEAFMNSAG